MAGLVYDLEHDVPDGAYVSFSVFMFGKQLSTKDVKNTDSVIPFGTQLSRKSRSEWGNVDYHVKCHTEPSVWEFEANISFFSSDVKA